MVFRWKKNLISRLISKVTMICCCGKVRRKVCGFIYTTKNSRILHLYNGQEAILSGLINSIDVKKDKVITAYDVMFCP